MATLSAMTGRGIATLLVGLAALGAASGAAAADLAGPDTHRGSVTPIPASSPSVPIDPVPSLSPDSPAPAMPVTFKTHLVNLNGPNGYLVPMPGAWLLTQDQGFQEKWAPPIAPPIPYFARVEVVTGASNTPAEFVSSRPQALARSTQVSNLEVLNSGDNTLLVCFVLEASATDFRRECTAYAWVPGPGAQPTDNADLEIAVTGRRKDLTGIQALRDLIMNNVSRPH